MNYTQLEAFLSSPRLLKYQNAAASNDDAISLYLFNLEVAQAFLPLISTFEVCLRNQIFASIERNFNDPTWLLNLSRYTKSTFLLSELATATRKAGSAADSNKITSSLAFGFWVAFFEERIYKDFNGSQMRAFPYLKRGANRQIIHEQLIIIKSLRNRISHAEPLLFDHTGQVSKNKLLDVHAEIYQLLGYMDRNLIPWFRSFDTLPAVLQSLP
jgi:hypothetical protein